MKEKEKAIASETERVQHVTVGASEEVSNLLLREGSVPLTHGMSLAELIRRPELSYQQLESIDPDRPVLSDEIAEQVNIQIKYKGYIDRQIKQVKEFKRLEGKRIPERFDYDLVPSLRIEARQKLKQFRPSSLGQASRIAGVSPADISVLLIYLEAHKKDI